MEIRWHETTPPEEPGLMAELVWDAGRRALGVVPAWVFDETDVDAMLRHLWDLTGAYSRAIEEERIGTAPPPKTIVRQFWKPFHLPESPADEQQARVYEAEATVPDGREFTTVPECQAYVDQVLASEFWRRRFPRYTRVTVKDGRGRWHGVANKPKRELLLPRVSRNERAILHELAHVVTSLRFAPHGPEFARTYVDLVRAIKGDAAARVLLEAFDRHDVGVNGHPAG